MPPPQNRPGQPWAARRIQPRAWIFWPRLRLLLGGHPLWNSNAAIATKSNSQIGMRSLAMLCCKLFSSVRTLASLASLDQETPARSSAVRSLMRRIDKLGELNKSADEIVEEGKAY